MPISVTQSRRPVQTVVALVVVSIQIVARASLEGQFEIGPRLCVHSLQQCCEPIVSRFDSLERATARHFQTIPEYQSRDNATHLGASLLSAQCTLLDGASNQWRMQRVGPFETTGGMPWLLLEWRDVVGLLSVTGAGVTAFEMVPVDASGAVLRSPPVQAHHAWLWDRSAPRRTFVAHLSADSGCAADGFATCLAQDMNGSALYLRGRLDSQLLLNDVRPQHSPPLRWWFHIALRLARGDEAALSSLRLYGPRTPGAPLSTYAVPPTVECVMYISYELTVGGALAGSLSRFHTHPTARFDGAWLFAASPSQLGLGSVRPHCPTPTAAVVLATRFDSRPNHGPNQRLIEQMLRLAAGRLVCSASRRLENVSGVWIGRQSDTWCADGWRLGPGDVLTSIALSGTLTPPSANPRPPYWQHSNWYLYYTATTGGSHYDVERYTDADCPASS